MTRPKTRADADESGDPPSRLRLKLSTVGDVSRELARLYREAKAGRRDVADASKLANMLSTLGRLIEGAELERRVEELERRQGGQQAPGARPHTRH